MSAPLHPVQKQLEENRRELLDLSTKNRLISIPLGSKSARLVQIFDERADEVYKRLITERKTFTFLPGKVRSKSQTSNEMDEDVEQLVELPLPDDDDVDEVTGKAKRHTDSRLQTRLTPEVLQRRLFDLHNEARTLIEEQGVNVLYLAIGLLHWIDRNTANTPRQSPLLLIPVDLTRSSAQERFALRWREEDLMDNLSLAEKLRSEYQVQLPSLGQEDAETFDLATYFSAVEQSIAGVTGWSVEADGMCLGFFSFAKYLMYRDLDANLWPESHSLLEQPLLNQLLFPKEELMKESGLTLPHSLDEWISPERLDHVVDADSSQTIAVELVRQGQNLVIQGPPGTGKSQTITNIIATAVLDGKRVLFLAEKLAALEVVKRRLEREGLAALCLELHSNKSRKASVLGELKVTWELGKPQMEGVSFQALNEQLHVHRTLLNEHPLRLHHSKLNPIPSAYTLLGTITTLGLPKGAETLVALPDIRALFPETIASIRHNLDQLSQSIATVGDPATHVWRGVGLRRYLGTERQEFLQRLEVLSTQAQGLHELSETSANALMLRIEEPTLERLELFQSLLEFSRYKPSGSLFSLSQPVWEESYASIEKLTLLKAQFEALTLVLKDVVVAGIWQEDLTRVQRPLTEHESSFFKILNSDYKQAKKEFARQLRIPLPSDVSERDRLLNQIIKGQELYRSLTLQAALGEQAFGSRWAEEGNAQELVKQAEWMRQGIEKGFSNLERKAALSVTSEIANQLLATIPEQIAKYREQLNWLSDRLNLNERVYGPSDKIPFLEANYQFQQWKQSIDQLPEWITYQNTLQTCLNGPAKAVVALFIDGKLSPTELRSSFDRILAKQQLETLLQGEPELTDFNGDIHNEHIAGFQRLDRLRLDLARLNVLTQHQQNFPIKKSVGAVGMVLGEVNKQRGHRPVRQLLTAAGRVIQDLKPVFMMSPLSVAQFLEPGKVEFDLLVIDEASQIKPVDALGAIARCRQLVVVGDEKQLPPSSFFSKLTSNDGAKETEEDDNESNLVKAKELESILSLCKARGVTDTLLRWHYRSKHHSLIAISNSQYYEGKLFVVPSPWKPNAGLGLVWRPVKGIYDRSVTRTNPIEAKEVALAVMDHALNRPEETLGVAAFSMAQQRAIQDEVEVQRRKYPEVEAFFAKHAHEPFFVKNLENVQGDERDVIFLSLGYGRDSSGKLSMNFGPLNKVGGERRLNVLISRARRRCEVFSSITDLDMEVTPATSQGVADLKQFLQYARTGEVHSGTSNAAGIQHSLEQAIKMSLEETYGWEVHTHVGIAGFFVDLAIVDPQRKGRYVLGIECDGISYHKAASARDRDRLRQSILHSQGWLMHRVWAMDFFKKKEATLAKIEQAYDEALSLLEESDALTLVSPERNIFYRSEETKPEPSENEYQVATDISVPTHDPYLLYPGQFSELTLQVLKVESPIHVDELTTRLRELWGWAKAGSKFRRLVEESIDVLILTETVQRQENGFVTVKDHPLKIRRRGENAPIGTRKPSYIAPQELDLVLIECTRLVKALTREEAAKEASMMLGFKMLSSEFRTLLYERIDKLLATGSLKETEGKMHLS